MTRRSSRSRRGAAAVELAVLLPFLAFLFVIAVDWARVFYFSLVVENCARNGAVFASDPYASVQSPYATLQDAALADAPNLNPKPTVTSVSGVDAAGNRYVDCKVRYVFKTVSNFPGVPKASTVVRTVRVYQAAQTPK